MGAKSKMPPLTPRQRLDLIVSVSVGSVAAFVILWAARHGHWGLNWTWGGLGFAAALCGAAGSTCAALSWLVIRPQPPGDPNDAMFLPDPPWWWVVVRPIVLWTVILAGPMNAWALVSITAAWAGLFLIRTRLWPLRGWFVRELDDVKHNPPN